MGWAGATPGQSVQSFTARTGLLLQPEPGRPWGPPTRALNPQEPTRPDHERAVGHAMAEVRAPARAFNLERASM